MNRSIRDNEDIIKQFRDWLTQTAEEIDALDPRTDDAAPEVDPRIQELQETLEIVSEEDNAPANFTACTSGPTAWTEGITRFDETIDLDRASDTGQPKDGPDVRPDAAAGALPEEITSPPVEVGLRQLVEALTAMRHEAKLQTKSTRSLADTVQSTLAGFDAAMREFQATAQSRDTEARQLRAAERSLEESAMPYVEALVELDEALQRGARNFEATTRTSPECSDQLLDELLDDIPWWSRWAARLWHPWLHRHYIKTLERISTQDIAHLKEGYMLIRERIQRVLHQRDIHRIESVGRHVDSEEMNVVELVDSPESAPETVVEEIRPGYRWRNRVVRFAEVRATSGQPKISADDKNDHDKQWHDNRVLDSSQLERDVNSRPVGRGIK